MNKYKYLFMAIEAFKYRDIQWLINLLSYTRRKNEMGVTDLDLKYEGDQCFYYSNGGWLPIEGKYNSRGLFFYNEWLDLPAGVVKNCPDGIKDTSIGMVIINLVCLVEAFGTKIGYINKKISPSYIEDYIGAKLTDTPKDVNEKRDDSLFYVDEYIKYCDGCLFLTQLTQVCVPGSTEKALSPPPGIEEIRNKLFEENRDKLTDVNTIAAIGKKLEEIDAEYLKGDRSLDFLINKNKDLLTVRKKMFLTPGFSMGFEDKVQVMEKPFGEGLDVKQLEVYINEARSGSFSRGKETQLGGSTVKALLRSSNNFKIAIEDCGSALGYNYTFNTLEDVKSKIGYWYIEKNGSSVKIDEQNAERLVGKTLLLRTPGYCKAHGVSFCERCCGPSLSMNKYGLANAVEGIGSAILYIFMKAMHGKALRSVKMDFNKILS